MVISWLIHIGMTMSVSQSVGAYMISSMYMFMVMSLGFMAQGCGVQPLSMTSWSSAACVLCNMSPPAKLPA